MRILILSAFPLLDRHNYKKRFLQELTNKSYFEPPQAALVHGQTRLKDYWKEASKFGLFNGFRKAKTAARGPEQPGSLQRLAKSFGISCQAFDRFNSAECGRYILDFEADVIINVSGQYIPKQILSSAGIGVVGPHYALLPQIRGGDTVRWSILLDAPMYVSHMILATAMDMGDIIRKEALAVRKGDTVDDIYGKCQQMNAKGLLEILDQIDRGELVRCPQRKEDGTTFYRMGRDLKTKVDTILAEHRYQHYV